MKRPNSVSIAALLACLTAGAAGEKPFRVQDDVLGFPQFEVIFPEEYILDSDAHTQLKNPPSKSRAAISSDRTGSPAPSSTNTVSQSDHTELSRPLRTQDEPTSDSGFQSTEEDTIESYEEMILGDHRYLCSIPETSTVSANEAAKSNTADDEKKELARATDRGLELLKDMENRCMYYAAGWWSYSFCYMNQVRQFHALLPGNGIPPYPPAEDPATHSFVLGRFRAGKKSKESGQETSPRGPVTEVATHQGNGDSRYLVQYLEDGTRCDLTGKNRKIEVQFHCHPQSTDHIGWIKEVTTCSYLMVIYTPRLCNDVAFQPPREDKPHGIACREILSPDQIPEWEAARAARIKQQIEGPTSEPLPIVGDIEVGAMNLVGKEGKRIEKGKVAFAGEEKVEVVAISEGGEVKRLSKEDLKKYNLDPEKIETLRKQLEDVAEGKDWKMEMVDANGQRGLRGIIDSEEEAEEGGGGSQRTQGKQKNQEGNAKNKMAEEPKEKKRKGESKPKGKREAGDEEAETGSDETYKEEL